jgi:hypothetical protein
VRLLLKRRQTAASCTGADSHLILAPVQDRFACEELREDGFDLLPLPRASGRLVAQEQEHVVRVTAGNVSVQQCKSCASSGRGTLARHLIGIPPSLVMKR